MLLSAFAIVFLALCLLAAAVDFATLTIPNELNLALLALFPLAALASGLDSALIAGHLKAGGGAFLVAVAMFLLGWIGGGDAKMAPVAVLWIGPRGGVEFLYAMALAGGVLALSLALCRRLAPATAGEGRFRALDRGAGLPYGVAISAGVFVSAHESPLLAGLLGEIGPLH